MKTEPLQAGERFGWLTVLGPSHERKTWAKHRKCVEVECDCGTRKSVIAGELRAGRAVSCGCKRGKRHLPAITKRGTYLSSKFIMAQKGAEERGIEFFLPREAYYAMLMRACVYCGSPATGVDRIDSGKPYTEANCQPMCKRCNAAKGNQSEERFYAWVQHIYHGMTARFGGTP